MLGLLLGFGTGAGVLTGCGSTSQNPKADDDRSPSTTATATATVTSDTGAATTEGSASGSSSTGSGGTGGSGGAVQTASTGPSTGPSATGTGGSSSGTGGEGGTTIPACEDATVPPGRTPCVRDSDCSGADIACFLPSSPPRLVCGDGCNPSRTCVSDEDCVEGAICVEVEDPCCVALGDDSTGTHCLAPCSETSCGAGVCGDDGQCVEAPCDQGSCGPNQACNTETGRCEFRACSSDEDCDCGFCAEVCQDGPGYCDFITGG